jgi:hypothetical protein
MSFYQWGFQLPGALALTTHHAMGMPHPASKILSDRTTNLSLILVAFKARAICSIFLGSKLITHRINGAKQLLTSRLERFFPVFASAS